MRRLILLLFGSATPAISIAVAAQAVAAPAISPRPIDSETWVQKTDYPVEAIRRSQEGAVSFQLAIDSEGKVTDCDVVRSVSQELDAATCRALLRSARFEPARDTNGAATSSTYSSELRWELPQVPLVSFAPAIDIVESWLVPASGLQTCREISHGALPKVLPNLTCPPNSERPDEVPHGNGVKMLRSNMLVIGAKPSSWPKIEAETSDRTQIHITVNQAGIVVECKGAGRKLQRDLLAQRTSNFCVLLANGGEPVFEAAAEGSPLRRGRLELIESVDAFGAAWISTKDR